MLISCSNDNTSTWIIFTEWNNIYSAIIIDNFKEWIKIFILKLQRHNFDFPSLLAIAYWSVILNPFESNIICNPVYEESNNELFEKFFIKITEMYHTDTIQNLLDNFVLKLAVNLR